jgi:hypothetical protein
MSHKMPARYCTPPDEDDVHVPAEFQNLHTVRFNAFRYFFTFRFKYYTLPPTSSVFSESMTSRTLFGLYPMVYLWFIP